MWDHEVDLVAIGAGIGGLAGAIATVDAGNEVFVVDATPTVDGEDVGAGARSLRAWLQSTGVDTPTKDYFTGCGEWARESASVGPDLPVPVRTASPVRHGDAVEPFLGSRLADWAATCLGSPYGMLYTGPAGRTLTTMRAADGGTVEVIPIGRIDGDVTTNGAPALQHWLTAQARTRGIDVATWHFERLVFEGGAVAGAVFDTGDGPFAVRARHGVSVAPNAPSRVEAERLAVPREGGGRQVCLLGRTASRFGRVEILVTTETGSPARPAPCRAYRRSLRAGLHQGQLLRSGPRFCGEVDGNLPGGQ